LNKNIVIDKQDKPFDKIIEFFSLGSTICPSNNYFDGDWFIYASDDYPHLLNKTFIVKDIKELEDSIEVSIIFLKNEKDNKYNYIEGDNDILGFSKDTIFDTKLLQVDYHYILEIYHNLGENKTIIQTLVYEKPGE